MQTKRKAVKFIKRQNYTTKISQTHSTQLGNMSKMMKYTFEND